jgi:hypothetical protein
MVGGALSRSLVHPAAQVLAIAVGVLFVIGMNSTNAMHAFVALPVKDQANVAAGLLVVLVAAVALSRANRINSAVPFLARRSARAFVESIMGQEPEKIPGSDGMSVMRKVFHLERGAIAADVVIRKVTLPFWQACIDAMDPPPARRQAG